NLESAVLGALRVKKFSVFASGNNGLEVAQTHGWSEKEKFRIRIVCEDPIFENISVEKKVLCIVNEDYEQTLKGEGILAGPLIDPEKETVFGMLKIEEMNFMDLNISSIEAFKGLCDLIGVAYSNASRHKELKAHSIYDSEYPNLFTYQFYEVQVEFLKKLCKKLNEPLVEISITFQEKKSTEVETVLSNELYSSIVSFLPNTSQIFLGDRNVGNVLIVIPAVETKIGTEVINTILPVIDSNELLKGNKVNMQLKQLNTYEEKRCLDNEQQFPKN
ncbi:MAG: hypothetical protein AAGG81_02950, partial [Chlamydiota bacterium]